MQKFVVLLRGINVSGQKKIIMADLRKMLEKMDFNDVQTYIQSGNIVLKSGMVNCNEVASKIKKGILDFYGFNVFVLVKKNEELKQIFDNNPFNDPADIENKKIYFALLESAPELEKVTELINTEFENEQFLISDTCVYLNYFNGAGKAKLSNNLIVRKLKVSATSRNYRTMVKLLEMSV